MYKIPLTNAPNQTFNMVVPINGGNREFIMTLNYNSVAEYWAMTLVDAETKTTLYSQIPMLASSGDFMNLALQLDYLDIGSINVVMIDGDEACRPNDENLGTTYILVWGDNE